ncbi:MAG: hypothetical protein AAF439_08130 [Pseudomonadota bacterium]
MPAYHRRQTPKVVAGKVQKKNRHQPTKTYWNTVQKVPVIDKERAGRGYKHLLSKFDIHSFIEIVPEWDQLSEGLDAILLAAGERGYDGWYNHLGVVAICAWERDLWRVTTSDHFNEHRAVYDRLGISYEKRGPDYLCKFTENTARAYQLLHIFFARAGSSP